MPIWAYVAVLMIPAIILLLPRIVILVMGGWTFSIPSGSMAPTLPVGSTVLAKGLSNQQTPDRGIVAVFAHPSRPDVDYVMRVVGLPGDSVQMRNGDLHLNGSQVDVGPSEQVKYLQEANAGSQAAGCTPADTSDRMWCIFSERSETLPGSITYRTRSLGPSPVDDTAVFVVPDGHIMVMGDNRDNSVDSRFNSLGMIPIENLKYQAWLFYMVPDPNGWPLRRFLEPVQ